MPEGYTETLQLTFIPKCWHDISNIIYIQLTYTPQIVGIIYLIQKYIFLDIYIPQPCPVPEGHTETLQLTVIPQVFA